MRLVLVGSSSFIARHVLAAGHAAGWDVTQFSRASELAGRIGSTDIVVNFTLHPDYRSGAYRRETDCDLAVAEAAARADAHFAMLSTRRVYPEGARWNAREDGAAGGDETAYGRNKAASEAAIRALGSRVTIFRLANIFGMEFTPDAPRRTFFALMLRGLKEEDIIRFDMSRQTRRDFIPVEICARGLVGALRQGRTGTFNLGSGRPTPCGTLAGWVIEGYGQGELRDEKAVKDEFYLNMDTWNSCFDPLLDAGELEDYCREVGRKLKCARS